MAMTDPHQPGRSLVLAAEQAWTALAEQLVLETRSIVHAPGEPLRIAVPDTLHIALVRDALRFEYAIGAADDRTLTLHRIIERWLEAGAAVQLLTSGAAAEDAAALGRRFPALRWRVRAQLAALVVICAGFCFVGSAGIARGMPDGDVGTLVIHNPNSPWPGTAGEAFDALWRTSTALDREAAHAW